MAQAEEYEPTPILPPKTRRATAVDRLYLLGRELVGIPVNNNSLFASVAQQIDDHTYTARYIRTHATYHGLGNLQKYIQGKDLKPKEIIQWRVDVSKYKEDMYWNRKKAYLILRLISDSLSRKIVVVRDEEEDTWVFGKDGTPITGRTIVVVEMSRSKPEYHATRMREGAILPEIAADDQDSCDEEEEDDYDYVLKANEDWEDFSFVRRYSTASSKSSGIGDEPLIGFQASQFYGTEEDQLQEMNREIDFLSSNASSFFESIARQVPHRNITQRYLRHRVIRIGRKRTDWFYRFITDTPEDFLERLKRLENERVWCAEMWFMVMVMLTRILKLEKIVVIKSFCKPVMCPNDGQPITDNTIVVVQNERNDRYHATKVIPGKGRRKQQPSVRGTPVLSRKGSSSPQLNVQAKTINRKKNSLRKNLEASAPKEETDAQLMLIGREEVPLRSDGNSQFVAVFKQAQDPALNPSYLRLLTYRTGIRSPQIFSRLVDNRDEILLNEMRKIRENCYWDPAMSDLIFSVLAAAIKRDIVILRHHKSPLFYPGDAVLDDDAIVLVQVNVTPTDFSSTRKSTLRQMLREEEETAPTILPASPIPGPSHVERPHYEYSRTASVRSNRSERSFSTSSLKEALLSPFKRGFSKIRRSKLVLRLRPRPTPDPLPVLNTPPHSDVEGDGGHLGLEQRQAEVEDEDYMEPVERRRGRGQILPTPPSPDITAFAEKDHRMPGRRSRSIERLPPAPPPPMEPTAVEQDYMQPISRSWRSASDKFPRRRQRLTLPRKLRRSGGEYRESDKV